MGNHTSAHPKDGEAHIEFADCHYQGHFARTNLFPWTKRPNLWQPRSQTDLLELFLNKSLNMLKAPFRTWILEFFWKINYQFLEIWPCSFQIPKFPTPRRENKCFVLLAMLGVLSILVSKLLSTPWRTSFLKRYSTLTPVLPKAPLVRGLVFWDQLYSLLYSIETQGMKYQTRKFHDSTWLLGIGTGRWHSNLRSPSSMLDPIWRWDN